ncbi:hypothetical protein G6F55_010053 [Rhizopus delemar]|uniref:Uncharacterized protein n=2 Tax=Rhizopus TaxID=4842 RepID=A0A9P6YUC8_9FUNG|nr:hypothetical protein G6F55_010053 [Rhizopus delemar]KAG1537128.1 hypothetical protein G6F51_010559 [Rhizopus arrhizus]KAG1520410.1 hypothetical protein G6F52_007689 [Rhizopus delemar]KAG1564740.1 hypothetical protein G6F50_010730 [Rhizopus delemar]KAG1579973.1 hypothetical protein G6F48_010769 [Rhizopus delemar]
MIHGTNLYSNAQGSSLSTYAFWKDWVSFLQESDKFHPYSPESHSIIRCGKGISSRPNLDRGIYKRHVEGHVERKHPLPSEYVPYINSVIDSEGLQNYKKAIRNVPDEENGPAYEFFENVFRASYALHTTFQDIADGETAFNSILLYPFLRAVSGVVAVEVNECKTDFKDGEAQLESMTQQLKASGLYKDNKFQYKADGLIKMYGVKNLEILLLETSYHFGSTDKCKAGFDHHKGLFGSLSMLKTIADCFSLETTVYLWSLRFESSACLYEFWLEDKLIIKPSIEDKLEALPDFISFYWNMKCLLKESVDEILQLKKEHNETLIKRRFDDSPFPSLSSLVNPSILRLTEEQDKFGMSLLGPFFSNPSSPE